VSRSHGEEGIELFGGRRIRFRTRTKGGGRGFSCDCLILDEGMFLPESAHGALLPTLSARPNPQVWYTASAVDQFVHEHGVVLSRVRERGLRGDDPRLAYFEWSAGDVPPEMAGDLLEDRLAWERSNPALGIRVSEEHVANECRSMDSRTFAVERLGLGDWPSTDRATATVIDVARWRTLVDGQSVLADPVCFAFDVSPDRSSASISAAGRRPDGLFHVEVVERGKGASWVAGRVGELRDRWSPVGVWCDAMGPAASLLPQLEEFGVVVESVSARDHANACGLLFDTVQEAGLRHLGSQDLEDAVRGAVSRPLGDAWAWARRTSSVDISPLVSVTLALWGAHSSRSAWVGW
jgi:hypothetical protein